MPAALILTITFRFFIVGLYIMIPEAITNVSRLAGSPVRSSRKVSVVETPYYHDQHHQIWPEIMHHYMWHDKKC